MIERNKVTLIGYICETAPIVMKHNDNLANFTLITRYFSRSRYTQDIRESVDKHSITANFSEIPFKPGDRVFIEGVRKNSEILATKILILATDNIKN